MITDINIGVRVRPRPIDASCTWSVRWGFETFFYGSGLSVPFLGEIALVKPPEMMVGH